MANVLPKSQDMGTLAKDAGSGFPRETNMMEKSVKQILCQPSIHFPESVPQKRLRLGSFGCRWN